MKPLLDRLIVTRPAPEAAAWTQTLRAQGWPALALPLIRIAPPSSASDRAGLQHWRAHWAEADAVLFVSGAAVSHFFAAPVAPAPPALRTRFWAPGPGTAGLLAPRLQALGLAAARCIDAPRADAAQFDSEHLWPVVASQVGPGRRVLIVRGTSAGVKDAPAGLAGTGRDWLIRQCTAVGARVEACAAYERAAPPLTAQDRASIDEATTPGSVWLFSSSEALAPLRALKPPSDWGAATALVTHPRIAETARAVGFGHVVQTRPALSDVVGALESGWTPRP